MVGSWQRPTNIALAAERRPSSIKAIYMNPFATHDWNGFMRLVDLIERTELNALVLDIKEETVFFKTQVDFFRDAKVVTPLYDVTNMLEALKKRGIHAIARQVIFKDSRIAEARPDLAVKHKRTGGLWRDYGGVAWVNAFEPEPWEANAALAVEAVRLGFDEIQYDYVRFPSDGDLATMDFGRPYTEQARTDAIVEFLKLSRRRILTAGGKLAADVFGYTLLVDNDLGIGQNVERIARTVDVVCPMVYPSHWPSGSLALNGHPNNYPYETIAITMARAQDKLGRHAHKVRPWLQDFSLPGLRAYGAAEVRAQIDGARETDVDGWMIWDPSNRYHDKAFREE
ncbi:MAG: putative glycoside hydrolase [Thermomicrobiales bacterium]